MAHICNLCNYDTDDKFNFQRHINTKKHKLNLNMSFPHMAKTVNVNNAVNTTNIANSIDNSTHKTGTEQQDTSKRDIFVCGFCNSKYSTTNKLTKHVANCRDRKKFKILVDELQDRHNKEIAHITELHKIEIDKYRIEIDLLKGMRDKEIENNERMFNALNLEIKHLKSLIDSAGIIIKHSMSALSYAMQNYKDAPAIQMFQDYAALKYEQNDTEFIENLIIEYKNKRLPAHLGDFIIKTYKKDDPTQQSIWNSDTNRLTYMLKEIINNNQTDWKIDKKGIKTTKYIIEPLLKHIDELLRAYIDGFDMECNLYAPNEAERKMLKLKYTTDILTNIEDKILHDEVLKYISSHFYINKHV